MPYCCPLATHLAWSTHLSCPDPPPQAWTSGLELPTAGCTTGASIREVGRGGALEPGEALTHFAWSSGQPAADTDSSGYKGSCLGRDTHLPWLHLPGCWAQDPAVRTGSGLRGSRVEWGLACPGLTWAATRLCVCEDPRLRRPRRRMPPLGELRVPLRKLVPNRARSFNVCLEKRRLVSGVAHKVGLQGPATL